MHAALTELLYLRDAELRMVDAVVLSLVDGGVVLDKMLLRHPRRSAP